MSLLERPANYINGVINRRPETRLVASVKSSDEELVSLYVDHADAEALEILFARHSAMVMNVVKQLLYDSHDVEDTFQAVFLKLAAKSSSIRNRSSLAAWLHRVAHSESMQLLRTRKRNKAEAIYEEELTDGSSDSPVDSSIAEREQMAFLHDELNSLPEKYRNPLILCFLEGKSRLEAAEALGATDASVKARLMRGRELLRKRLLRRGIALTTVFALWEGSQASAAAVSSALTTQTLAACSAQSAGLVAKGSLIKIASNHVFTIASKPIAIGTLAATTLVMVGSFFVLSVSPESAKTVPAASIPPAPLPSEEVQQEGQRLIGLYEQSLDALKSVKFHLERHTKELGGVFGTETWRYYHKGDFAVLNGEWRYRYKYIGNHYNAWLFPGFGSTEMLKSDESFIRFMHTYDVDQDQLLKPDDRPDGELVQVCSSVTYADGSIEANAMINQNRISDQESLGYLPYENNLRLPELMKASKPYFEKTEQVDGHLTSVVKSKGDWGEHIIWLDPKYGYMPRKIIAVKTGTDIFLGWTVDDLSPHNNPNDRRPNSDYDKIQVEVSDIELQQIEDHFVMSGYKVELTRFYVDGSTFKTRFDYQLSGFSLEVQPEDLKQTIIIPEGMSVFVTNKPQVQHVWKDGKIVEAAEGVNVEEFEELDISGDVSE